MVNIGADTVDYNQGSANAIVRTVEDRLRDFVSVKDFGATGDGVTSDQDALQKAVAFANQEGRSLYWPKGSYVSTANLPNFHLVKHHGTGILVRGSSSFHFSLHPGVVNTIFAAPNGLSGYDGLSKDQPMQTLEDAIDVLRNWPEALLSGDWQIKLLAGRFLSGVRIAEFPACRTMIKIQGSRDEAGNLLTIFDGVRKPSIEAINVVLGYPRVAFEFLRFENWRNDSGAGVGIQTRYGGEVDVIDCEFSNCDIGVFCNGPRLRIYGGIYDSSDYGVFASYQSNFTTYPSQSYIEEGTIDKKRRPKFNNIKNSAFHCARGSYGHVDYIDVSDAAVGVSLGEMSRAHVMGCNFKRCTEAAIRCRGSSQWLDDPDPENINSFNMGTADACKKIATHDGGSRETRVHGQAYGEVEYRQMVSKTLINHTGTTDSTILTFEGENATSSFLVRMPKYYFADGQKKIRVRIEGTLTGADAKSLSVYSSSILIHTLSTELNGQFILEWVVHSQSTSQQRVSAMWLIDGQLPIVKNLTTNLNIGAPELLANIRAKINDPAATITIRRMEGYVTG